MDYTFSKKAQIIVRATPEDKAKIKTMAERANLDVGKYMINSALGNQQDQNSKAAYDAAKILVSVQRMLDDLPDSKRKKELRKECEAVWQSLKY